MPVFYEIVAAVNLEKCFSFFRPKLFTALRKYTTHDFTADLGAGVTVGIVALPLALALGIASIPADKLGPEWPSPPAIGLYTAIIAGFLISLLGGSRVAIGGPTGAFVGIVFATAATYGFANLLICTLMAGVMLIFMGVARMGSMIKFIPFPVTTGFTTGIAIILFSTQVKDFLGLTLENVPSDFVLKMIALTKSLQSVNGQALAMAIGVLALLVWWPDKWARRVPASIVAVLAGTAVAAVFQLDVETIGTRFGEIPRNLPTPHLPEFDFSKLKELIRPAFTIALLAAIESLLCCVVADGMTDERHDSNTELVAQGVANIGSAMIGGIPATGAIARTATNVRSGARTPVAGIIHALTLLAIVLIAAPWAKHIPLAVLAGVLVYIAARMGEWHQFTRLWKWPKSDAVVFLAAFSLTVLADLTVAVEVGLVLAALLFVKRVSETTQIAKMAEAHFDEPEDRAAGVKAPDGVIVFSVFGAFFFGAVDKLETALAQVQQEPSVLVLRMRQVLAMDASGLDALEDLHDKLLKKGRHLLLVGPHAQPLLMMSKAGFIEKVGQTNVCGDLTEAYARANELMQPK